MKKRKNQLLYRSMADKDDTRWSCAAGLDEMCSPGCYLLQLRHNCPGTTLPLPACDEEHYITATLIITESGTDEQLQRNRLIGQTLIMPDCNDGRTRIFNRTLKKGNSNRTWNNWNNIAQSSMDDEITNTEDLIASVTELKSQTKEIKTDLSSETARTKEAEAAITEDAILSGSLNVNQDTDRVTLAYRNIDATEVSEVDILAASTEKAGVMSAEDKVTLKSQVQKLIKLEGIASSGELAGVTTAGQYYYNTNDNTIKRYDGSRYTTVPFHEGAIYNCKNQLYVWDGNSLVITTKQIFEDLKSTTSDTNILLSAVLDEIRVEVGSINISAGGGNLSVPNRFRTVSYLQPPFNLTMSTGFEVKYICKYDKQKAYLGYSTPTSSRNVNIGDDGYLYRIMFARTDEGAIDIEELNNSIADFKGEITILSETIEHLEDEQEVFKAQLQDTQFVVALPVSQLDSYYINSVGNTSYSEGFAVRTYKLEGAKQIKIEGTGGGVAKRYAFYSAEEVSQNNVIQVGPTMDDTDFSEVIDIPYGAVMLAVTYRESWQQAIYMSKESSIVPQFKRKKLKLLCFGNSFTLGSVGYIPWLINENIDLSIGIAFTSGGTLGPTYSGVENLYDKLTNNTAYTYFKYTNNSVEWVRKSATPTEIIEDDDWDIITLQQGSNNAPDYTTYQPYLNKCIDLIAEKMGKPVKFGWIMPHADTNVLSNNEEANILSASERVMNETVVQVIIPYGAAIANARKTTLSAVGDFGNLLYEGKHLQNGLPQLVANYCTLLSIFDIVGMNEKSIIGMTSLEVTDDWVSIHKIPNASAVGACVGVTSENCRIAAKCAIMAVKNPFSVTDMTGLV